MMTKLAALIAKENKRLMAQPFMRLGVGALAAVMIGLCFGPGRFFARAEASLDSFFVFHPYVFALACPALATSVWAQDRRDGVLEYGRALSMPMAWVALAKFLAAWRVLAMAMLLCVPFVVLVGVMGPLDWTQAIWAMVASLLFAAMLFMASLAISAPLQSPALGFAISVGFCGVIVLGTHGPLEKLLGQAGLSAQAFDGLAHYDRLVSGQLDATALIFIASVFAGFWVILSSYLGNFSKVAR